MRALKDYVGETSPTQDLLLVAALGVGLYIVYQIVQGAKTAAQAAGAVYKGAQVLAAPVASLIATAWAGMTIVSNMPLNGNVLWPDGSQTPLANAALKKDALGNVYINDGQGSLYQLQPSDANGNWPAVQITDPSQIGQNLSANLTQAQIGSSAANFGVTNPAAGW